MDVRPSRRRYLVYQDCVESPLLEAARAGDGQALEQLIRTYAGRIRHEADGDCVVTLACPPEAARAPAQSGAARFMILPVDVSATVGDADLLGAFGATLVQTDLRIAATGWSCPGEVAYGTASDAYRLVGAPALHAAGATGRGVGVIAIDAPLAPDEKPVTSRLTLLPVPASTLAASPDGHAEMVLRNVHAIAPDAELFLVPILPDRITRLPSFLGDAMATYGFLEDMIEDARKERGGIFRWVVVNAWGVFDRSADLPAGHPDSYCANPDHPFSRMVDEAGRRHLVDVVFSAGNCGALCPSERCGALDRGGGNSIHGVNGHANVLSVGAARTDALWLGYSSEGPGPFDGTAEKPDLVAPSHFAEDDDAGQINSGTSAAAGIAAGVIAALRGLPEVGVVEMPPARLRAVLRETASRGGRAGQGWEPRLGHGMIDAAAALERVRAMVAPPQDVSSDRACA